MPRDILLSSITPYFLFCLKKSQYPLFSQLARVTFQTHIRSRRKLTQLLASLVTHMWTQCPWGQTIPIHPNWHGIYLMEVTCRYSKRRSRSTYLFTSAHLWISTHLHALGPAETSTHYKNLVIKWSTFREKWVEGALKRIFTYPFYFLLTFYKHISMYST